jgi:hypothetical protein
LKLSKTKRYSVNHIIFLSILSEVFYNNIWLPFYSQRRVLTWCSFSFVSTTRCDAELERDLRLSRFIVRFNPSRSSVTCATTYGVVRLKLFKQWFAATANMLPTDMNSIWWMIFFSNFFESVSFNAQRVFLSLSSKIFFFDPRKKICKGFLNHLLNL